jgi:hypothetical protein
VSHEVGVQWQQVTMSGIILPFLEFILLESGYQSLLADKDSEDWCAKIWCDFKETGGDCVFCVGILLVAGDNILAEI